MQYRFIASLVLLLAIAAPCMAAEASQDPEQQRRLAEQKLKLVEMLVNSPKALATSSANSDAETVTQINRARELLKQAREALAGQHYPEATQALDGALRSVSSANSRNAGGLSDSVQRQRLQDMGAQVTTYRAALADLAQGKAGAEAKATLVQVDALAEEARKLAAGDRLGEANKKMAEAYKVAVESISKLRAGQEVVLSLKFDTPADEYAYEQRRFQSNEVLVGMMIAEGRAANEKLRPLIDGFVQKANTIKDAAAMQAQANNHKDAVESMEKALIQLNRALQYMGVPVY